MTFEQWLVIWLSGHGLEKKNIGERVAKRLGAHLLAWLQSVRICLFCVMITKWQPQQIRLSEIMWTQWLCRAIPLIGLMKQVATEAGVDIIHGLNSTGLNCGQCGCNYWWVPNRNNRKWHWATNMAIFPKQTSQPPGDSLIIFNHFYHRRGSNLFFLE